MKTLDRVMVCLYLAVATLPVVAMKLHVKDHPVFGSVPPTPAPTLTFGAFHEEAFQKAYTAWFESRLGLKGYAVTTDNAILYHAFHDTKAGAQVMLGDDDVLFKDEDLAYYNKTGADLPTQARVDALADNIAALQTRLRASGSALVPMIIPSKTSLYRDKIPARWTRALGEPRPSDQKVYDAFVRALDARKVAYVDARATFNGMDRADVWGKEGRHWTDYGACVALREAVRLYPVLTGRASLPFECTLAHKWRPKTHDDFDLWRLLNTWRPARRTRAIPISEHGPPPQIERPASILVVGTSFCWGLLREAQASGVFAGIHMDYYNRTLVEWPANVHSEVHPHTPAWRAAFVGKDLYVLDLLEVFLLAPDTYVDEFLQQLTTELTTPAAPVPVVTEGARIDAVTDLGLADGKHYFELWGAFPNPSMPYAVTVSCDGVALPGAQFFQKPDGSQLTISIGDPGPGACDRTLTPPRTLGVSCTFHVQQGATIGSPVFGPRRVCPGPQGSAGQDAQGNCLSSLPGC